MMKTAIERLFDARIHYYARIRCKNKVNAEKVKVCKMGRFVSNLSIPHGQCYGIKFFANTVTRIKRITI